MNLVHIIVVVGLDSARPYDLELRSRGLQVHVDMRPPVHAGVMQRDQLHALRRHSPNVGDRLQEPATKELVKAVGALVQMGSSSSLPALVHGRLLALKSVLIV